MCDFHGECEGAEDESRCGDFSYPGGGSGWTDASIGGQGWMLHRNVTTEEEYLYVSEAPGQQLTRAQTRTPLLGPSGPACTLSFDFALTGNVTHIGELSVRVLDSLLGMSPPLWEFSGKTAAGGEGAWRHVDLPIGFREHRFQLAFEAHAEELPPGAAIRVKDVRFVGCHAHYFPSSPTGDAQRTAIASTARSYIIIIYSSEK
ncbi:Apical endosomal glycoprotein [Liparis tanakae]|uniref:Apical endosomal glycoprotein n=1 Tax=Liparis tanakae TaxID=230148 RepID=A0A4Z2EDY0_9TELE|nr:Apical endosomal glycoprotein [Liparis tanakae]